MEVRRARPGSLLTSWFLRGLGELSALERLLGLGELLWRPLRFLSSSLELCCPLDLPEGLSLVSPGLPERSLLFPLELIGRSSSRSLLSSFLSLGLRDLLSSFLSLGLKDLLSSVLSLGLRDLLSGRLLGGLSLLPPPVSSLRRVSVLWGDRVVLSPFSLLVLERSGLLLRCRVPLSVRGDGSLFRPLGLLERSSLLLLLPGAGLPALPFLRSLEPLSSSLGGAFDGELSLRLLRSRGLLDRCSLLFSFFASLGLTFLLALGLLSLFCPRCFSGLFLRFASLIRASGLYSSFS